VSRTSRTFLGVWTCPSGNSCTVFFRRERPGLEHLEFEWDQMPLSPTDHIDYLGRILPRVHRRLAEYKEEPIPPTLVVVALDAPGRAL
jgi:hypothetical protein